MAELGGASSIDGLGGLAMDDRRMLERIAKRRRLRAGEFVYTQGDAASLTSRPAVAGSHRPRLWSPR